jgi:4-amino-4-deoxy-L-arabinose transferase-like glycosyltransferase
MSRLREHSGLIIILMAFLALGIVYLWATPLLETPDEPSHFSVVKYIADEGRLPPAHPAPPQAGPVPVVQPGPPVYYAPPLYYVLGALLVADLDTDGFDAGVVPNPNWARGWAPTPGRSPENKHIYVHTAAQRPPYAGWAMAMLRLRVFSLLLGGATVVGVYALARTLWSARSISLGGVTGQSWVLATTALVAFNPAFLFVTVGVTNDALLIALSTWAFLLMARIVSGEVSHRWGSVALLGVLLGLGTLTKQSALALLPVAALAVVWGARSPRRALQGLFLCFGLVTLIAGWWYVHNTLAYHDPLGFQPHQAPTEDWQPPLSLLVRQMGQALRGYWAVFGWGLILVEPLVYIISAAFSLIGLLGWLRRPARETHLKTAQERRVVVILALGGLLNLIGLLLWLLRTSAPYGRLLFPSLGPLASLLVLGWQRWLGRRHGRLFAWAVVLMLGLFAVIVPWRYLRPAYASPVVSPPAAGEATPLNARFDVRDVGAASSAETLRLLAYHMSSATARPGDQVTLILFWQTTAPLESPPSDGPSGAPSNGRPAGAPLTVFVQLAPQYPEDRVAGVDDYLGTSRYPSQVWQPGETIRQVHRLRLPEDAPAPVLYWFNVGLYRDPNGERLPVVADGNPVPDRTVRLGPLRVLSGDSFQPRQEVDYRLGSTIRLIGYDVEVVAADSVEVTLYWQAVAAPDQDLIAFVHLLDGQGQLIAQHDGPPRQGDYPTWAWQAGDEVPDSHTLIFPTGQTPGIYHLQVGLYRSEDGVRIPVLDGAGQRVPDDMAILTDIRLPTEGE